MTGPHTGLADAALGAIRGGTAAQTVLHDIRQGIAGPDALHAAMQAEFALGEPKRLEGFARELQKALERAAA